MELSKEIEKVGILLQELLDKQKRILEEVDDITFGIIADDGFDDVPDGVQDVMYMLNNYEIEKPSTEDLIKCEKKIKEFLVQKKS